MAYDKVVDSAQLDAGMTEVAQAIRAKGGTTEQLAWPDGFKAAVESIETGITPTGSIAIGENGTYDVADKATAVVNVLSNHLRFVYNNPADVSGYGNAFVLIASGDDTLKQVRSLDSLVVIYRASGDAPCVRSAIAMNVLEALPIYNFGAGPFFQASKRVDAEGNVTGANSVGLTDDTNITSGSGRIYITEDGDLRIYSNTNAYPIRAGEIVVDVLW